MANLASRHPANAAGPWFVDRSCINCDVSRQCAPGIFEEVDQQSVVARQPASDDERRAAVRALLACPTGSIGVVGETPATDGVFPEPIAEGVSYCGYTSRDSFGANSYFVARPAGNLMVDSPRFVQQLVRAFEAAGGLSRILLTHRDDVADARRYAAHFGARVAIHEDDSGAAPFATDLLRGREPAALTPTLLVIPVPGHTRGSVVYLLEGRFLFTGDSLYWSRRKRRLAAFRDACWYSWEEQARSLDRLAAHSFEWVLPGHGNRAQGEPARWRRELAQLVTEMGTTPADADW